MSKPELLSKYRNDVEDLKKCGKELDLTDAEISKIFEKCLKTFGDESKSSNDVRGSTAQNQLFRILKVFLLIVFIAVFIYVLLNVHQPTSSIVLRNVQGLIYPGFKLVRFFSVPIIRNYPSLTRLYDESCLVENPYFYVSDMECWPCENVHSVIDLTGFDNHSLYQSGIPYIVKTSQREVAFEQLRDSYVQNRDILMKEANSIKSNVNFHDLEELFSSNFSNSSESSTTHAAWRINKMRAAQVIRGLFPRPYFLSEWSGQSIERYVMVDAAQATGYALPNMECSYVFLAQGAGQRSIILKPSKECSTTCKTVSVVLKPSYVLWYNWWYWRPVSLPVENATATSVTYCYLHKIKDDGKMTGLN